MKRSLILMVLIGIAGVLMVGETQALTKMPKELNYMSFYLGNSSPYGDADGIPGFDFGGGLETDASNVWGDALYGGFDYGTVYFNHWSLAIGFRFVSHEFKNPVVDPDFTWTLNQGTKVRQYDVGCDFHYYLNDLRAKNWSPYAGVSLYSGFTTISAPGAESVNRLNLTFGLDFGAEIRVYKSKSSKNFVTLGSVNTYNLLATGDRPKYFQLGGVLRYFFSN